MSQISLSPNAAGTAIFTVAAPGTSTNRTLTLPDATGTVLSTADLATQAEAQAGSDNTKLMTPLRVSEAIASDIASQAQAEAGTDNTTLMTPLRAAQAISALSTTFLGTITTTSGTSQSLSGLTLTPYKFVLAVLNGLSTTSTSTHYITSAVAGREIGATAAANNLFGSVLIELASGVYITTTFQTGTAGYSYSGASGVSTASTSITFAVGGASPYDAGSIRVYGVR